MLEIQYQLPRTRRHKTKEQKKFEEDAEKGEELLNSIGRKAKKFKTTELAEEVHLLIKSVSLEQGISIREFVRESIMMKLLVEGYLDGTAVKKRQVVVSVDTFRKLYNKVFNNINTD